MFFIFRVFERYLQKAKEVKPPKASESIGPLVLVFEIQVVVLQNVGKKHTVLIKTSISLLLLFFLTLLYVESFKALTNILHQRVSANEKQRLVFGWLIHYATVLFCLGVYFGTFNVGMSNIVALMLKRLQVVLFFINPSAYLNGIFGSFQRTFTLLGVSEWHVSPLKADSKSPSDLAWTQMYNTCWKERFWSTF